MAYVYKLGDAVDAETGITIYSWSRPAFTVELEGSDEAYGRFKAERDHVDFYFSYYAFNQQICPREINSFRRAIVLKIPLVFSAFIASELKAGKLPELYPLYIKSMNEKFPFLDNESTPAYGFFKSQAFLQFIEDRQKKVLLKKSIQRFWPYSKK
jgi:hypothetical protein